ncbi:ESPR-type extended signal peptide-containing protein, partial [Paraburkholderia sediminicola]
MNKTYRVVWNTSTGTWGVASELAKGRRKSSSATGRRAALALGVAAGGLAFASGASASPYTFLGTGATQGDASNVVIGDGAWGGNCANSVTELVCDVAVGQKSYANQGSVAVGQSASASGVHSTAIGGQAVASGRDSVALGLMASATGISSTALGMGAVASMTETVAVGQLAHAVGGGASAFGVGANAVGLFSLAGGYLSTASEGAAVALGSNASATGGSSTAVGGAALAAGEGSLAAGDGAKGGGLSSTAVGRYANAVASSSVALGLSAVAGDSADLKKTSQVAIGNGSRATGDLAMALGSGAVATSANSVALGAGSTTTASNLDKVGYDPRSQAPAGTASSANGEVSVGSANKERRVTNVAAGLSDTDVVNVSQLKSEAMKSNNLGATTAAALGASSTYDSKIGTITGTTYQVAGATQHDVGTALKALDDATVQFNGAGGAANVKGYKIQ